MPKQEICLTAVLNNMKQMTKYLHGFYVYRKLQEMKRCSDWSDQLTEFALEESEILSGVHCKLVEQPDGLSPEEQWEHEEDFVWVVAGKRESEGERGREREEEREVGIGSFFKNTLK